MEDLAQQKEKARAEAFARRKAAHNGQDARAAQANLLDYLQPFRGLPTAGYMPIRTEIDVRPVMATLAQSGKVGVPVILGHGRPLVFHEWGADAKMQPGPFGAMVPVDPVEMVPRVVILPLVAFDRAGRRLGYGGGFYDRTLEILRRDGAVVAVGFAYGAQEAEALPHEPTDQPLDAVVTEKGVLTF